MWDATGQWGYYPSEYPMVFPPMFFHGTQPKPDLGNPKISKYLECCIATRAKFLTEFDGQVAVTGIWETKPVPVEFDAWLYALHLSQTYIQSLWQWSIANRPENAARQIDGMWGNLRLLQSFKSAYDLYSQLLWISDFYVAGMQGCLFSRVNNSLLMNMVNGLQQQRGLEPIEHGILDFAVLLDRDVFFDLFLMMVADANIPIGISLSPTLINQ